MKEVWRTWPEANTKARQFKKFALEVRGRAMVTFSENDILANSKENAVAIYMCSTKTFMHAWAMTDLTWSKNSTCTIMMWDPMTLRLWDSIIEYICQTTTKHMRKTQGTCSLPRKATSADQRLSWSMRLHPTHKKWVSKIRDNPVHIRHLKCVRCKFGGRSTLNRSWGVP